MKIVILEAYVNNPGDLSYDAFLRLGDVTVFDHTPAELLFERAKDAEIILSNKVVFSEDVLKKLPRLRYIGLMATGYNVVDIAAAAKRGIVVTNVPSYSTYAVAQHVFALLFALTNHVHEYNRLSHDGSWKNCGFFCLHGPSMTELCNKTLGIVGYGKIGRAVAKIALALGMNVVVFSRRPSCAPDVRDVSLAELFSGSDVITLHCPLTPETRGIIDVEALSLMKPGAFFLNTSRGPLVDEAALAQALNEEKIAGAGVDVLSKEPPAGDNPLLTAKNCIITPHIAWAPPETRARLLNISFENLQAFLRGAPQNVVSPYAHS